MRFTSQKRRQPPTIIVVALIDILVVLVIFLMVTTTFKQQPALKLALPESSQALKTGASETPPLVITIAANGSLFVGAKNDPKTPEALKSILTAAVEKNSQARVAINADKAVTFGRIVSVMDIVKESGVKTVSAFTRQAAK
jgi:biopolymer transport protein ExbD